jgi:hypothetical protein
LPAQRRAGGFLIFLRWPEDGFCANIAWEVNSCFDRAMSLFAAGYQEDVQIN